MAKVELLTPPQPVLLDYRGVKKLKDVLSSISGVAADGETLWTVSDECRTVERLHRAGDSFGWVESLSLEAHLPSGKDEADLEGLDVVNGRLWLCGSHSQTRPKAAIEGNLNPDIHPRPSRSLLGAVEVGSNPRGAFYALPFTGDGSLRRRLGEGPLLKPFIDLPSKENGLDIEGLAVFDDKVLLGLRGPVIGGLGLIAELSLRPDGMVGDEKPVLHPLDMDGLGIRDLARWDKDVIVLAGPVTRADGPFRFYLWEALRDLRPLPGLESHCWPVWREHPEGICRLSRGENDGLLVVYDSPDSSRISGSTYRADWFKVTGQ